MSPIRSLNLVGEGTFMNFSVPSMEPECRRRRAGMVGRSIIFGGKEKVEEFKKED